MHDQQADVEGAQADQPVKTSRRNDGKKSMRHVAAQVRQDYGTTRDGDRREGRRESDRKLRQLDTKIETLTQQMSAMCAKFETAQPGQQQLQSTATPAQATEPRQQTSRPCGTFYNQQQSFFCYECGAPGHIARNCEMRRQRLVSHASRITQRKVLINHLAEYRWCVNNRMSEHGMATPLDLEDVYR